MPLAFSFRLLPFPLHPAVQRLVIVGIDFNDVGTHLQGAHQQRKAKHFLVPTDGAFDVGDADAVYRPG
jgi:hypothetical protein